MTLQSSSTAFRNLTSKIKLGERLLHGGGCSVVYKAVLNDVEFLSNTVAVKFPDLHRMGDNRAKARQRWEREMRAGQSVVHPNILLFLGFCENPDPNYREFVGIVLPFCGNGNVNAFIKRFPHADRLRILSGVAAGIFALHSAHEPVVHGDIKAANILIDDDGNPQLADFGLSRICEVKGFTTQNINGTCRWMAVELLRAGNDPIRTTKASDIWAFAMTILEILTGKWPFSEIESELQYIVRMLSTNIRPQKPSGDCISDAVWKALDCCWSEDASKRPDAAHIGLVLDLMNGGNLGELDVSTVEAIVDGAFDAVGPQLRGAHLVSRPYKCKWFSCCESFSNLDGLILHECGEFQSRKALIQ